MQLHVPTSGACGGDACKELIEFEKHSPSAKVFERRPYHEAENNSNKRNTHSLINKTIEVMKHQQIRMM